MLWSGQETCAVDGNWLMSCTQSVVVNSFLQIGSLSHLGPQGSILSPTLANILDQRTPEAPSTLIFYDSTIVTWVSSGAQGEHINIKLDSAAEDKLIKE